MRDARGDLTARRRDLINLMLPLAMRERWNHGDAMHQSDMREWIIGSIQLAAISSALERCGPEEDDEPGGDIDWGDGGPLDAE